MTKNMMKTALNRTIKMTGVAFNKVRSNTGQETYRPLDIYMKLSPDDFAGIAEKYGIDETIRYIQTMENRRMKG